MVNARATALGRASDLREVTPTAILLSQSQGEFWVTEADVLSQIPPAFRHIVTAYRVVRDEQRPHEEHEGRYYRRAIVMFYAPAKKK